MRFGCLGAATIHQFFLAPKKLRPLSIARVAGYVDLELLCWDALDPVGTVCIDQKNSTILRYFEASLLAGKHEQAAVLE